MLFNSIQFLFIFFPITLLLYYGVVPLSGGERGKAMALVMLIATSLYFYAQWGGALFPLFLSLTVNAFFGLHMSKHGDKRPKTLFMTAIAFNILFLGYYKYTGFLLSNMTWLIGKNATFAGHELPLGISFFTFTQIAFLTDLYNKHIDFWHPLEYGTIITFFPHLVAGPILFHHNLIPQLRKNRTFKLDSTRIMVGLALLTMGLCKKVLIADTLAPYADTIFNGVASGGIPDTGQAWRGALLYSLQLYFDFSGYSDMALGLGYMLGLKLPINFFSPYKATNVSDFWRRWHISLGYFLMNYLYIPLGGNQKGFLRKLVNLMIVMGLCGLWHGAGWTFVAWGLLHGVLLVGHNLWKAGPGRLTDKLAGPLALFWSGLSVLLTFACIVTGWVLFRSANFADAWTMLASMAGHGSGHLQGLVVGNSEKWLFWTLAICWLLPNSYQVLSSYKPATNVHGRFKSLQPSTMLTFRPTITWSLGLACLLVVCIVGFLCTGNSPYLYFIF